MESKLIAHYDMLLQLFCFVCLQVVILLLATIAYSTTVYSMYVIFFIINSGVDRVEFLTAMLVQVKII